MVQRSFSHLPSVSCCCPYRKWTVLYIHVFLHFSQLTPLQEVVFKTKSHISSHFPKESADVDTYACFITVLQLTSLLWVAVLRINCAIPPHICFANNLLHIQLSKFCTHTLNMNHSQTYNKTRSKKKIAALFHKEAICTSYVQRGLVGYIF